MYRITIRIRGGPRIRAPWALVCLIILFLASAPAQPLGRAAAADPQAADAFIPHSPGLHFYLTNFDRAPNTATTACAAGYHMASLWEIRDVTNLTYDYDHPAAYKKTDSGRGVPSGWYGWVRTGYDSSTANTAGVGNCGAWTSANGSHYGTAVRLNTDWNVPVTNLSPWDPGIFTCDRIGPVWCAGYFHAIYLPMLRTS